MKRLGYVITLLISIFFVSEIVYATPVNASFNDDNFYKCVITAYNIVNNDSKTVEYSLTDDELLTIKVLNCNGYQKDDNDKITDVTGIEKLTNLEELYLNYNKINTINLSSNNKLKKLYVDNNNISNIKLDDLNSLESVRLAGNNMSTVSLKNNAALISLDLGNLSTYENNKTKDECKGNNISTIDLSGAPNLEYLHACSNKFTTLDLSSNTKLKSFKAKNNELTELNFGQNENLVEIDITNNKMANIDLSKLANLKTFYANNNLLEKIKLDNNTKLERLTLESNSISEIDLSSNTLLEILNLNNNKLLNLKIDKNTKLKSLEVKNNMLANLDISKNNQISLLNVSNNRLMSIDLSNLNVVLESNITYEGQSIEVVVPYNNPYTLTLKDYESNIDLSKVSMVENDNIKYDNSTGVASFVSKLDSIKYNYKTGLSKNMDVTLKLLFDEKPQSEYADEKAESPKTGQYFGGILSLVALAAVLYFLKTKRNSKIAKI